MATHTIRGKGNLYETYNNNLVATVSYKIQEERDKEGNLVRWWGELTLVDYVRLSDGDRYEIELEDKRRGRCSLKRRINKAVILVPPRYYYLIHGSGALE